MKILAVIVSLLFLIGSFGLFGYSFDAAEPLNILLFLGGLAAVTIAVAIPIHLVKRFD